MVNRLQVNPLQVNPLVEGFKAVCDELREEFSGHATKEDVIQGCKAVFDEMMNELELKYKETKYLTKSLSAKVASVEGEAEARFSKFLEQEVSKRLEECVAVRTKSLEESYANKVVELAKNYEDKQKSVEASLARMEQLIGSLSIPQPQVMVNVPNQIMPAPIVNIPEQPTPIVHVKVPESIINVQVPQQEKPIVNVSVPEMVVNVARQELPAPIVNVQVPKQEPSIVNFTAPEQPAPVVNVQVPVPESIINVNVPKQDTATPIVNVSMPKRITTKSITYDGANRPVQIIETEQDQDVKEDK